MTFIQKRGYMLQPSDDYFMSLVVKYTQRGWKIQQTMWLRITVSITPSGDIDVLEIDTPGEYLWTLAMSVGQRHPTLFWNMHSSDSVAPRVHMTS